MDRHARKQYDVQPRDFAGRLLHQLPTPHTALVEVYLETYLSNPKPDNRVGLYRSGTRVLESLTKLDAFQHAPWTDGHLDGIADSP